MELVGDLGGTNLRLALCDASGTRPRLERVRSMASRGVAGLGEAVERFLAEEGVARLDGAAFGVAGPVVENRAHLTNLGWEVDAGALGQRLGVERLLLVNDLLAVSLAVELLEPHQLASLQGGLEQEEGTVAVVGLGTGLGMSFLVRTPTGEPVAIPSEGGHMSFPPRSEREWRLLQFVQRELGGRVSSERIVSGPGLFRVYRFLIEEGARPDPEVGRRIEEAGDDPSQIVSEQGLAGGCPVCAEALDLFVSAFGSVAGDAALIAAAEGGVYLAGGIPPKILKKLTGGPFLEAFRDKGRFEAYLSKLPVRVILDDTAALLGCARYLASSRRAPA